MKMRVFSVRRRKAGGLIKRLGLDSFAAASSKELGKAFAELRKLSIAGGRKCIRRLPLRQRRKALAMLRSVSRKSAKLKKLIKAAV